jgi:hypothetical protein
VRGTTAPRRSGGEAFASYQPASVRRHRRAQGGSPMRRSIRPTRANGSGIGTSRPARPRRKLQQLVRLDLRRVARSGRNWPDSSLTRGRSRGRCASRSTRDRGWGGWNSGGLSFLTPWAMVPR